MLYNGDELRLKNIANFIKKFGNYDYRDHGNLLYYKSSINPIARIKYKLDNNGYSIIEYKGKEYSIMNKDGEYIDEIWNLYRSGEGLEVGFQDESGNLIGDIHTYRIWMSPYETASIVPNKSDSAKSKIPALNGYIKINGQLIHQSNTKKELVEKLKPMPEGGQMIGLLGDPV